MTLPDETARRRVADDLGTTFLVEAGAGTGKTTVLVQRLLALVRSGRGRLERVAAITFTEKAAAELRVRLRAEIDAALLNPLSDTQRHNLQAARLQLERAQLSTVHAFCAALLRERPVEARVDPGFTVLDQLAARILRSEVWQEWLAQEMDRGPDVLKQALRTGLTLTHLETLRDFVVEQRDCLHLLSPAAVWSLPEFRTLVVRSLARLSTLRASCMNDADRALAQ
ncbi:MAG: UvrD-helicase domain-containing protein, partial [Candidatus Binatia bacterium]